MSEALLTALVFGGLAAGVPLMLAGIGELISQRAGVLNVGLEGMMVVGAYGGFVVVLASGSTGLGFLAGAAVGALVSLIMVMLCVRMGLNQIVVGIAIVIGAEGLTSLLHAAQFAATYPRIGRTTALSIPWLSDLPVLGQGLFGHHPVAYLTILAAIVAAWVLQRTPAGLALRAVGERPEAVDAAGVSVVRTRSAAAMAAGVGGGLGGAYLAVINSGNFIPFMTGGRGFIAIVLAMLARGRPLWVVAGAFIYGLSVSLATALQLTGVRLRSEVVFSIPFALVLVVLVLFGRHAYLPSALTLPYRRGER